MGKNAQSLKRWWGVTKPSKTLLFFQFLTSVIPSAIHVLEAIPAAQAITCLTVADYNGAILNLCIAFGLELLSTISWEIEYRIDIAQLKRIYPRINKQLFDKIFIADDANFKYTSKEKMINIISNNIVTLSDFCDYLSYKAAYFVEAITTLIIICTTNIFIGILIFAIALIVYLLINALNIAVGKQSLAISEEKDKLTESFSDMVDGRYLSNDLNLKGGLEEKYTKKVDGILGHYKKRKVLKSVRDNWVYLLYTFIILIATIFLVKMVEGNTLTLTLYLIVTPYLTSAIQKFVDFFSLSSNLQDANNAALRVKTLLDMSEKDMIEFGNNSTDRINGAITFTNVSYKDTDKVDKSLGNLKLFNAQIAKNQIVLFEGIRNCGKRSLFYMLRRAVRPDQGTITFDAINIYDFDIETYKHNITYITNKPYFFNDSILENLKIVETNKKKIIAACKEVGIHETIMALPDGYDTNLTTNTGALNAQTKFLLGLARAILTKSEIFMVYEFPIGLSSSEQQTIKTILKKLSERRTILVFSAMNPIDDILDRHFVIEKGEITEVATPKRKRAAKVVPDVVTDSAPTSHWEGKLSSK